ncbi:temptin-like [Physella acuta]|uniref:temptin-like n=1 Tax=Physella acuta TaxID=109671 RepID=UPI0027DDF275|nr:temptin-like [Physella acuta]
MFSIVYLACSLAAVTAFQAYQAYIPNGDQVPNVCAIGTWPGVGHIASLGAGVLNDFGRDFADAGHVWTEELCHRDSDLDGKTNGEELGDPHCHFTPSKPGHLLEATGHPGI